MDDFIFQIFKGPVATGELKIGSLHFHAKNLLYFLIYFALYILIACNNFTFALYYYIIIIYFISCILIVWNNILASYYSFINGGPLKTSRS